MVLMLRFSTIDTLLLILVLLLVSIALVGLYRLVSVEIAFRKYVKTEGKRRK